MIALPIGALASMATIGKPARAQQTQRFIVQNNYWALPGKAEEVFQWRIHASDVRERLGLPRGQVLRCDKVILKLFRALFGKWNIRTRQSDLLTLL
jgi:hypothetical protein